MHLEEATSEITEALDRLNTLVIAKDRAVLAEFDKSAELVLIGSKHGEIVLGPQAFATHIERLFALPISFHWEWEKIQVSLAGQIAWVFALGDLVVGGVSGVQRAPYRLTGVLEKQGARWVWHMYHGSEPAK
jgi:ketosteroid isomerase-like protein